MLTFAMLSRKVGRAVALGLLRGGVNVVCYTSSGERFDRLYQEARSLGLIAQQQQDEDDDEEGGSEGKGAQMLLSSHLSDGAKCGVWVVGKFDPQVCVCVCVCAF